MTMAESVIVDPSAVSVELQHQVEQFLYYEARLLDERRFDEWLALFTDDIHYWMPQRYNRLGRELDKEVGAPGTMASFDEDRKSLSQRVFRLKTGMAWAEDPPSRTRHLVTNVWIKPTTSEDEIDVESYFLIYRNRGEDEVDLWAGRRSDLLRKGGDSGWQIARRHILIDQGIILSKNLSVFF